jgi:hypothetical protein
MRLQMLDSMTRFLSKDTVLNNATEGELAQYFGGRAKLDPGKVWDGFLKPMLNAMDSKTRDELATRMEAYSNEIASSTMHIGPSGALVADEDDPEKKPDGKGGTNTNDGPTTLRGWRDATRNQVEDINEVNRKFWKQPSLK